MSSDLEPPVKSFKMAPLVMLHEVMITCEKCSGSVAAKFHSLSGQNVNTAKVSESGMSNVNFVICNNCSRTRSTALQYPCCTKQNDYLYSQDHKISETKITVEIRSDCSQCVPFDELPQPSTTSASPLVTYEEVANNSNSLKTILQSHSINSGFVGVGIRPGCLLPVVLLGIMKAGCGFYPLSFRKSLADYFPNRAVIPFDWLIADEDYFRANNGIKWESVSSYHTISLDGVHVYLVKLENVTVSNLEPLKPYDYAYAMRTSGTTGNGRIVLVPHLSIVHNVLELAHLFSLNAQDVILAISPSTFDPSVIDLFASLASGARIIYLSDQTKLVPGQVLDIIKEEKVTFIQCTPSFLQMFDNKMLADDLFGRTTTLRALALGGEKCPGRSFFRRFIPRSSWDRIKIFNLYGITEVSCWASVASVDLTVSDEEVSLGSPLTHIKLDILSSSGASEGEIVIGYESQRSCIVYTESGDLIKPFTITSSKGYNFLQTGDYGKLENNQMFYAGRLDRIRKRNGIKVDLELVERTALKDENCAQAFCVDWNQEIILAIQVRPADGRYRAVIVSEILQRLRSELPFDCYPDRVICTTDYLPVNENGKLDWKKIYKTSYKYDSKSRAFTPSEGEFLKIFYTLWNFYTRRVFSAEPPGEEDYFIACGGTSMSTNLFVEDFFDKIQEFGTDLHIQNEKILKSALLRKNAKQVEAAFLDVIDDASYQCHLSVVSSFSEESIQTQDFNEPHDLSLTTGIDAGPLCLKTPPVSAQVLNIRVGLCVDATPVIMHHPSEGEVCVVGSHSGSLHCFSISKLASMFSVKDDSKAAETALVWKKQFRDRIESSVVPCPKSVFGYFGSHDGKVYKFSVLNGSIRWSFDAGAELRASPSLSLDGSSLVTSSSKNVHCVDSNNGVLRWTRSFDFYIFQTLSVAVSSQHVIFAAINGIWCLDLSSGDVIWNFDHERICTSPLMLSPLSTPPRHGEENPILFGDTEGNVLALKENNGMHLWTSKTGSESPLNPFYLHKCALSVEEVNYVAVTSHSGAVYILNPLTGQLKHQFCSKVQLRSRPIALDISQESNLSTCSYLFNSKEGNMFSLSLPDSSNCNLQLSKLFDYGDDGAESYSSPAVSTKHGILMVGSRDNCLHFAKLT